MEMLRVLGVDAMRCSLYARMSETLKGEHEMEQEMVDPLAEIRSTTLCSSAGENILNHLRPTTH